MNILYMDPCSSHRWGKVLHVRSILGSNDRERSHMRVEGHVPPLPTTNQRTNREEQRGPSGQKGSRPQTSAQDREFPDVSPDTPITHTITLSDSQNSPGSPFQNLFGILSYCGQGGTRARSPRCCEKSRQRQPAQPLHNPLFEHIWAADSF